MTIWELFDYISLKINKSPIRVQMSRPSSKLDIKPLDYCKSLKQMKFENQEEIGLLKVQGN